MRFLHTSDWHAGRRWRGVDRLPELVRVLDGLAAAVETQGVDVVLLTGDVFDTGTPPAAAERAVFSWLRRVSAAGAETVVIAGNHDDPRRIEAWGLLAELARVRVVGRPREAEEGGLIEIVRPSGERALIAAVPFAGAAEYVRADVRATDGSASRQSYADGLSGLIARLSAGFRRDTVNVVLAHTHVDGAVLSGSERRVHLGEQWAVTGQSALPATAHYVGLGHLHRPQSIPGPVPAEYAGSPLAMDFGEAEDTKSFVLVDAVPGSPAVLTRVPYTGGKRLVRFEGSWEAFEAAADGFGDAWVKVTLRLDRRAGSGGDAGSRDLAARVRARVPGVLSLSIVVPNEAPPAAEGRTARSPVDAFRTYLASKDAAADPALLAAFTELLTQAEGAS